ncbi:T9SS type B sorting domain-containing protein [Flavobacterium sp. NST-5]|uniref:T9SS type B sorting domain-containing protein n=1 Tax=Flavobacterium ichthyis TaxID=2698827 RepID=A0ABW9ZAY9_9FLAO|nr:T9SS type B sorting domain-containing protein [Flavobacterium ichthyis]NBL64482.1 T9SS type B sorting domain-containing protein [Flavobacterium ichthyis]
MKKYLLLFLVWLPIAGLSQQIVVDNTSHTVPQLVNEVLINSSCIEATNITWRTGSNFSSDNGIGYFTNTNPNFPMQSGVILSTGNAMRASGPNINNLSDGNNDAWIGDTDLEDVLANAGIEMQSVNATVLEFDFVALSPNFSFDFLFASEEYGNYQCYFSDAFAFLLTNRNTGETRNLAVIPNSITPISVFTVRNYLYNSQCESVNAEYFGLFNGGSQAENAAIDFNGQTKLMQARSILVPNTPYHIKLVIADRRDYQEDSAIFISSSSFNIGQEILGDDLTLASENAICFGESHTIQSNLSNTEYSFTWKKNNVIIEGENQPNLTVTEPGTYTLIYNSLAFPCETPLSDSILVEFFPEIVVPPLKNLYKCDTGASTYDYNLAENNAVLSSLDAGSTISYHYSEVDAMANVSPLDENILVTPNTTIFARITNARGCVTVRNFQLLTTNPPIATAPSNLTSCAVEIDGNQGIFIFSQQNNSILDGLSSDIFAVSYHLSTEDAATGANAVSENGLLAQNAETIYVRLYNKTDVDCFATTSFEIFVKNLPQVDTIENQLVCDEFTLPTLTHGNYFSASGGNGTPFFAGDVIDFTTTIYVYAETGGTPNCSNETSFNITVLDPESIIPASNTYCTEYILPNLTAGNYYTQPNGQGTQIPAGTRITQNQTIYVYYQFPAEPFCIVNGAFEVEIIPFTRLSNFQNVFRCESYVLPSLTHGKYFARPNGVDEIPAGTVITTTQNIYVYTQNGICSDQKRFTVYIGINTPPNAENCSNYVLPRLAIGNYFTGPAGSGNMIPAGTLISTSQRIYIYVATEDIPNCTDNVYFDVIISNPFPQIDGDVTVCGGYVLPPISVGNYYTGTQGTGIQLLAGHTVSTSQRIYIYKEILPGQNCTNEISFMVNVIKLPSISSRSDIGPICGAYTLTPLEHGNYFTGINGTGTQLNAGDIITETQTIYIYSKTDTNPVCESQNSFTITIVDVPLDILEPVIACNEFILPALTHGNYYTQPNKQGELLYEGQRISTTQTLYIYNEIDNRGQICSREVPFEITIVATPEITEIPLEVRTFCDDDDSNDGITEVNLNVLNDFVFGTFQPSEYAVLYFLSENDAVLHQNPIESTTATTVFVKLFSLISRECYDIVPIRLVVKQTPEAILQEGIICQDIDTGEAINSHVMSTNLSSSFHTFQWFFNGNLIENATQSYFTASQPGMYSVLATSTLTGCVSKEISAEVLLSQQAVVSYFVSNEFNDNQDITVTATGLGNYLYQLDDGIPQVNPVFTNVSSGEHLITVIDSNGCLTTTIKAFVVNYPKFFTPNGDGFNDYWNIHDLAHQPDALIDIFDRYGKFIIQIKPSAATGWDGNLNGKALFSTDYWFKVTYYVDGQQKEFRSHFAMKR